MRSSPSDVADTHLRLSPSEGGGGETIRRHPPRGLLPIPEVAVVYRHRRVNLGEPIWSVSCALESDFLLKEIAELLRIWDGDDRRSIQRIANEQREQIQLTLDDVHRMKAVLPHRMH